VVYQLQGDKGDLPRMMAVLLGVVGVSLYAWKRVVDRWEKNRAYILGLLLCSAGLVALGATGPGQPGWVMAVLALVGIGMGAHWIVPFAMVPDTIDHGHMQVGERQTGMYYGLYGLVDKLARTLGTVLLAATLDLTGYAPNVAQSPDALQGIVLMTGLVPALCLALAVPLLLAYPITRARHAAIRRGVDTGTVQADDSGSAARGRNKRRPETGVRPSQLQA